MTKRQILQNTTRTLTNRLKDGHWGKNVVQDCNNTMKYTVSLALLSNLVVNTVTRSNGVCLFLFSIFYINVLGNTLQK